MESGITVNDTFISMLPLTTPAEKLILSNVPPFIRDETLMKELSQRGKKSPLLQHVVAQEKCPHDPAQQGPRPEPGVQDQGGGL